MTPIQPVFRLTVYAPSNEDPTETTVLRPIGGAAHSDAFVVTTKQGISGSQPYLGLIKGRQGSLDVVTKRITTGNLSIPVFNPRVTAGGSNAVRWSDAFIGDAKGRTRLKGCKFLLERSLDAGSTFAPYFAGRIRNTATSRPLWWDLDCKDYADDLNRKVFVGAPHSSITYAANASLVPIGVSQAYANFDVTAPLRASLSWSGDAGVLKFDASQSPVLGLVTKTAKDGQSISSASLRIIKATKSGGGVGYFKWVRGGSYTLFGSPLDGTIETEIPDTSHRRYSQILVTPLPTTDARYTSASGWTTDLTCIAFLDGPPSTELPLLVNDVHPVQYLADLFDGKFSLFPGTTTLRPLAVRESSSWAALIADPSFGTMRDIVTAASKANDYAEKYICQRYNLAYRINASGQVVLIDLRRTASLTAAVSLTDDDLVADVEPTWNDSRDGAITAVQVTYYIDAVISDADLLAAPDIYPALPPTMIRTTANDALILNDLTTYRDVGEKIIKIDARGSRFADGEVSAAGALRSDELDKEIRAAVGDFLKPFASGTVTQPITYRLLGNAAGVYPGTYASITHAKLPNPATNQRGGGRLVLCLSRNDTDARIAIEWLDCGANTSAGVPTISSIAASAAPFALDVAVLLDAAGDAAEIWTAVTATGVGTRPAESAASWRFAGNLTASGTLRASPLPTGSRIWVRARSQGDSASLKIPSAWVFPSGSGYVDLTAATTSSGLTASNIKANRVDLAWTLGDASLAVEVYGVAGTVPGTWTSDMLLQTLAPGTLNTRIGFLVAATQYSFGVCVRDASGGRSAMATATLTTTSTYGIAPAPVLLDIAAGGFAA